MLLNVYGIQPSTSPKIISERGPKTEVSEIRSAIMAKVRCKDTKPEMIVRRALHRLGYRYRLHNKNLPGKPDIVFTSRKLAIFVHGCFWHRHEGCRRTSIPLTRRDYWEVKFNRNVARDQKNSRLLNESGWTVVIVWECDLKGSSWLHKLQTSLGAPVHHGVR